MYRQGKWTIHHVTDHYNPINFRDTPVISALARTRILADTATAYHDENDSLLLSSYVDYLNSHFEAFACTSDTETLKLLALTNKAISNILYRALQIADENPTKLSL